MRENIKEHDKVSKLESVEKLAEKQAWKLKQKLREEITLKF